MLTLARAKQIYSDMTYTILNEVKAFLMFLPCLLFLLSCSDSGLRSPKAQPPISYENRVMVNITPSRERIMVREATVSSWWWDESVAKRGIDADNPPPKSRYVEINKWQYDGEGITTSPHQVDFKSMLLNAGSEAFDGTVRFQLLARFEDYEKLYTTDPGGDSPVLLLDEFERIPWTDVGTVLQKKVNLKAKQEGTFEVRDYDLRNILNQEKDRKPLCALLFAVRIYDTSGNLIANKEKVIPVLLGD